MSNWIETGRGCVNTWECDENGHMNVRFYVARAFDGVAALMLELGVGPRALRRTRHVVVPHDQHIRFLRELHPGTPYVLRGGVISANHDRVVTYQELVRTTDGEVSATFTTEVGCADAETRNPLPLPHVVTVRSEHRSIERPKHGEPRGLVFGGARPSPTLDEARQLRMWSIYKGRVRPEECDTNGRMSSELVMGRISDGIPHFFEALTELPIAPESGIGGAALEYRIVYRKSPMHGDVLEIVSGLCAQSDKTTHFAHWMFDAETEECVATSEAIAVRFDLKARKALAWPPEAVRAAQQRVMPGLSA